jgi:hypothetical protein
MIRSVLNMFVALLAEAPFPDKDQHVKIKEPTKIEDLMAEEYWPVEGREPSEKIEEPVIPDNSALTWIFLLVAVIILIMIALVFILLSTSAG